MKPSHTQTPRTLSECTFTEIHAYAAAPTSNAGIWWWAIWLVVLVVSVWSLA